MPFAIEQLDGGRIRLHGRDAGLRFDVTFGPDGDAETGWMVEDGKRVDLTGPKREQVVSDCGDRYRDALHDRLGGVPCNACDAERRRMNWLTIEQCKAERGQIIEGTIRRATHHPKWSQRIKARLADTFAPDELRRIIGDCFDHAIRVAVEASPQDTPPPR